MSVQEIELIGLSSPLTTSKIESGERLDQIECSINDETPCYEKDMSEAQNPLRAFMSDLRRQINYSPLKQAFGKSSDKIEQFVQEHFDEMVAELIATGKSQKRLYKDDYTCCEIKVRWFNNSVQTLASATCGQGAFKEIREVVHLAGPLLENQPGSIYAYAKVKHRKELAAQLTAIEDQISKADCPECKAELEKKAEQIRARIEKNRKDFYKEACVSQDLPKDADFVKMWFVTKRKDPSKTKGILMEYCNFDLYDLVSIQTLPLPQPSFEDFCHIGFRIARSVAMMHERNKGLCHLDLKIGNILIKEENGQLVPKITDFGLAKKIGSSFSGPRGTLSYMAPEQFDIEISEIAPPMDNWSLGIILLEMFYGKEANLFRHNSDIDYVGSHFHESEKYPEFFATYKEIGLKLSDQLGLYPEVDTIIKGLLDISPDTRWTARQAATALETALNPPTQWVAYVPKHTPPKYA